MKNTKQPKAKSIAKNELTKSQQEKLLKIMKEAKMPVVMTDKDFKLGGRELDIRGLSEKNQTQMLFRMCCHAITYTKTLHEDVVDLLKVVMLIVKKLGVENITNAIDELEVSLLKEVQKDKN